MTNLAKTYCVLFVFFIGYQALKAENKPFSQLQDTAINVFSGVITGEKGDKMPYAVLSVEKTNIVSPSNDVLTGLIARTWPCVAISATRRKSS